MNHERATTLKQAFRMCNLGALTGSELARYWQNILQTNSKAV
ncbi:MAG: hypothetical protein AAGE59_17120 [Cyanobacteria bacterium P01_F01_bin.86]